MLPLDSQPMNDRWATFDCYGTLIDWNLGLRTAMERLWPRADGAALLARYHELEPVVEAGRGIPYRQVLAETHRRVADAEGLVIPPGQEDALATSLPAWPPFAEVPETLRLLRSSGWRLAILSNTDPDLLEASVRAIGVPVDLRIVASKIGSYKPAPGHWESFFERSGAERARHVHVAASLYHDVQPCAALGLRCVWINRLGEVSDLPRAGELPDLSRVPERLEELLPAG
jgi:2-haloacid dehalogenase